MGENMGQSFSSWLGVLSIGAAMLTNVAVAGPSVSVHAGPGPRWPVVGDLSAGEEVFIADCVKGWGQHDWCKVHASGLEGYIREGALAPVGQQIFVAPVFTTGATMLRRGPSSRSGVVAVVPASTEAHVAHCTGGWLRGWCKAHVGEKSGYLDSGVLHRTGVQ
jgi:uncharacterized protein YraI